MPIAFLAVIFQAVADWIDPEKGPVERVKERPPEPKLRHPKMPDDLFQSILDRTINDRISWSQDLYSFRARIGNEHCYIDNSKDVSFYDEYKISLSSSFSHPEVPRLRVEINKQQERYQQAYRERQLTRLRAQMENERTVNPEPAAVNPPDPPPTNEIETSRRRVIR